MKPASTVSTQTFSSVVGEALQLGVVVELGAMGEAAGPGEDRGDRVGRGLLALLVLAVVTGDGAVGGLGLDGLAVGGQQHRGHQTQRAEALGDRCPTARRRRSSCTPRRSRRTTSAPRPPCRRSGGARSGSSCLSNSALNSASKTAWKISMKRPSYGLQDGVLGRQIDRIAAGETVVERGAGEIADRVVEVVHRHGDARAREP